MGSFPAHTSVSSLSHGRRDEEGNEGYARQGHEGSHEEGRGYEGHEAQDHEGHESAYEGCSHDGYEEGHEEGHEVRLVATKRVLTYLTTVHFNSCCSVCTTIDFKGFEARIWSIVHSFRSALCPAKSQYFAQYFAFPCCS